MTNTALKMKEIESKERMQDKDLAFKKQESRRGRRNERITSGITALGRVAAGSVGKSILSKVLPAVFANDPEFYKKYIKDLDKFTNLATYFRLGSTKLKSYSDLNLLTKPQVPGIAVGVYYKTIGPNVGIDGYSQTSPINQILMRLKEQVLKSNSRSSVPYEAADIGLNIIATDSIVGFICEAERVLHVAQTYSGDNRYLAEGYISALGWDASAVLADLPNFRKYLVLAKTRFNSACVAPKGLSIYLRTGFLTQNIFRDNDRSSTPSQAYAYVANNFYELSVTGDACVSFDNYGRIAGAWTPTTWYTKVSEMIQRIAESADFVQMYADLRSAFGDNLLMMNTEVSDEPIKLIYDERAHEQISCSRSLPVTCDESGSGEWIDAEPATISNLTIGQSTNGYLYQGVVNTPLTMSIGFGTDFAAGGKYAVEKMYSVDLSHSDKGYTLNMHKDNISGDDILDVTRFNVSTKGLGQGSTHSLYTYGTEILQCWYINFYNMVNGQMSKYVLGSLNLIQHDKQTGSYGKMIFGPLQTMSCFDWMPLITFVSVLASTAVTAQSYATIGDIERAFSVDYTTIDKINEACILSEFYVDSGEFKR